MLAFPKRKATTLKSRISGEGFCLAVWIIYRTPDLTVISANEIHLT